MEEFVIPCIRYFSKTDEDCFFGWLNSIPGVASVRGEGRNLYVTLNSALLADDTLRELISLHYRYSIPMYSLSQFETPENKGWFRNDSAYWYSAIFG